MTYNTPPARRPKANHRRSWQAYHSLLTLTLAASNADPVSLAREQVLAAVNRARSHEGLSPLVVDLRLQRVGDAFCQRLLEENRRGHFAGDGVAPYLRYLLAGGTGFHRENVGTYQTSGKLSPQEVPRVAVELTEAMLAEKPPADGHRRSLLAPEATHLGVGIAFSPNRLVLTHEVATVVAEVQTIPPVCRPKGPLVFTGRLAPPWQPAAVEVLWERLPGGGPVPEGNSYSYPPRKAWFAPQEYLPGSRVSYPGPLRVGSGGRFQLRTATGPHEGVEILVLWGKRPGSSALYPVSIGGCVVVFGASPPTLQRWINLRQEVSP